MGIRVRLNGPVPIVASGFAALALAISVNALYLQAGRHPAPLFTRPTAKSERPAERDPLVEAVQAALKSVGSYGGPVDGVLGPQTKAAIAPTTRNSTMSRSSIAPVGARPCSSWKRRIACSVCGPKTPSERNCP